MAWGREKAAGAGAHDPRVDALRRARASAAPARATGPASEPTPERDPWAEPWDDEPRTPFWRRAGGGLARLVTTLVVVAVIAAAGFTAGAALRYLDRVDGFAPPALALVERADAIAVLTGGSERIAAAGRLLEAGRAGRLLVSGVNERASERQLRGLLGVGPDLFSCCVTLDFAALDTRGNARETARWMEGVPVGDTRPPRLIVVTSNYHMERSLLELSRAMPDVELVPYAVRGVDLDTERWWADASNVRVLAGEFVKLQLARAVDVPVLGTHVRAAMGLPARVVPVGDADGALGDEGAPTERGA